MQDLEEYIVENCAECLIGAKNCFLFKHIELIEKLVEQERDAVIDGMGDCKMYKAINLELRSYIKVGGSSR